MHRRMRVSHFGMSSPPPHIRVYTLCGTLLSFDGVEIVTVWELKRRIKDVLQVPRRVQVLVDGRQELANHETFRADRDDAALTVMIRGSCQACGLGVPPGGLEESQAEVRANSCDVFALPCRLFLFRNVASTPWRMRALWRRSERWCSSRRLRIWRSLCTDCSILWLSNPASRSTLERIQHGSFDRSARSTNCARRFAVSWSTEYQPRVSRQ